VFSRSFTFRGRRNLPHGKSNIGWQFQVAIGWTAGIAMATVATIGPFHMSYRNYQYNREEAALYNALSPVLWSSFRGLSVFAVTNGYAGKCHFSASLAKKSSQKLLYV